MKHFLRNLSALSLVLIIVWACDDTVPSLINEHPLNFSQPQVGQKAYFQRYTSTCGNMTLDFEFTGDTLEVALTEVDGQFYLEERFTSGSPLFNAGNTNAVPHKIEFKDDFALIPERTVSALFYFYGNDTIWLNPTQKENMTQNTCRIDFAGQTFVGEEIGNISNFQIGPVKEQNKTVVSCVPNWNIVQFDAYLIYDESVLSISHVVRDDGLIQGWSYIH
jgi:hypothetical protein